MRACSSGVKVLGVAVVLACADRSRDANSGDLDSIDVILEEDAASDMEAASADDVTLDSEDGDGAPTDSDTADVVVDVIDIGGDGEEPLAPGQFEYEPPMFVGDDCIDAGTLEPPPNGVIELDTPVEVDVEHFMWVTSFPEQAPGSVVRFTAEGEGAQLTMFAWGVESVCGVIEFDPRHRTDPLPPNVQEFPCAPNIIVAIYCISNSETCSLVARLVSPK